MKTSKMTCNKSQSKSFEKVHQDSVTANFDAWVGITLTKNDRWVNLSLGLIGGKPATIKDQKARFVSMRPGHVRELIDKLQKALVIQSNLIADQSDSEDTPEFDE